MSSTLSEFMKGKKRVKRAGQPKKKTGFTMRPLKYLAMMVVTVRNFVPFSTDVVTKGVIDDTEFAYRHQWNETCVVIGGPGEGKSRFVWRLSKKWTGLTQGKFHYCWDIDQIPDVNDGDWLHIDEYFIPEGAGKLNALQSLKNLYDTGRAKMICISVSTPTAPNTPFSTFEAIALAQDFDNRRNLFEINVPLPRYGMVYIGNAVMPLGQDEEEWLKYEAESYARKTAMWDVKGRKTIAPKFDPKLLAQEVIKWADEQKLVISSKAIASTFVHRLVEERKWPTNWKTEPDITNWIEIQGGIKANGAAATAPKKDYGEYTEDWDGLREFIEGWCLRQKPARKEYATATALWVVPENPPLSQEDVFDMIDFGKNPVKAATLAREIRTLRKRIQRPDREFTDFTESWVASQLDSLGARKAGGQGSADIVLEGGREVAVKFCIRNDPFYDYTVAPERDGVVVVVIPRRLQFFVIPIVGSVESEHLQLDSAEVRGRGGLVAIEELEKTVREMLANSAGKKNEKTQGLPVHEDTEEMKRDGVSEE